MVVSGKDSTVSMYKAFNVNALPFRRVSSIIEIGPGLHESRPDPPSYEIMFFYSLNASYFYQAYVLVL